MSREKHREKHGADCNCYSCTDSLRKVFLAAEAWDNAISDRDSCVSKLREAIKNHKKQIRSFMVLEIE